MRSRLEARLAAHLDHFPGPWEYEPRAFASKRGQYLPDFYLPPNEECPRPIYIEAKPTLDQAYKAMERMQIIWESDPRAGLMIVAAREGILFVAVEAGGRWEPYAWEWAA